MLFMDDEDEMINLQSYKYTRNDQEIADYVKLHMKMKLLNLLLYQVIYIMLIEVKVSKNLSFIEYCCIVNNSGTARNAYRADLGTI